VLSDLVGVKNIARAQAFLLLFVGVGALISVPLAGDFFLYLFFVIWLVRKTAIPPAAQLVQLVGLLSYNCIILCAL